MTLQRRLVLTTVAIVAAVAVVLGLASTIAVRHLVLGDRDQTLQAAFARSLQRPDLGTTPGREPPPGVSLPGQEIGTVMVLSDDQLAASGIRAQAGIQTADGPQGLTDRAADVEALLAVPTDGQARSVTLPSLGRYRVVASLDGDQHVVIGVPLTRVDNLLERLVVLEVVLTLLAVAGAVLVVTNRVRSSLRPLQRLAATAHEVSSLELTRGEVDLSVRVPEEEIGGDDEVAHLGEAINHMLDHVDNALVLRQASETTLRRFVADASHELRNPLAAIRGYAEVTRRGQDDLPGDTRFALDRIESEAVRMTALVEDMLLLARLDADPVLQIAPLDLTELVITSVSDAQVSGPDHQWRLQVPDEPLIVPADRNRLHQVLLNLLGNARAHTPPGTVVTTTLSTSDDGAWAQLSVGDDGPGIPEAIRATLFDRFTRADTSRARSSGGAGLGLAIVAALVGAHGGSVRLADDTPGATFVVQLPLGPQP